MTAAAAAAHTQTNFQWLCIQYQMETNCFPCKFKLTHDIIMKVRQISFCSADMLMQ